MKKKNLLSIGELSKITGVHIKSLRYYDDLGILKPAYIDPDSKYRYYTFQQKATVEAIQFCVDMGVPLKQFNTYTNEQENIFYTDLIKQGTSIVEKKIIQMQERLKRLKIMQDNVTRAEESYQSVTPKIYTLDARDCWLTPYEGKLLCEDASTISKSTILEIYQNGFQLGNTYGLILLPKDNQWVQYLFVDICVSDGTTSLEDYPQILHIPQGKYLCKATTESNISDAWNWSKNIVEKEQIEFIIETELFIGNYNFTDPVLEQRCFLK